jgi:hypothetical protein
VVIRRQLKRRYVLAFFQKLPSCLVGIEACASSHHWSRELQALGHTVRLMPPAYVKPYVKRQKNDATDAEAICEAVTRANMRFVPTKAPEQQGCLMLHRTRRLFIRQQTAVIKVRLGAPTAILAPIFHCFGATMPSFGRALDKGMPDAEFYAAIADVEAAHRRSEALCTATNTCLSRAEIKRTQSIAAELERARADMLLTLGPNTTEGALARVRLMLGDVCSGTGTV